eukprot:Rhum_TRINITY_DN24849_c0_g1::Rhum_TRINITY_DN24849_c0_g1_i1::g.180275::m.180275/K14803/PTC2_3; protein phosphatase PTC2/3
MGKKKGAGGAAKKGQPQESKKDFDDLLKQLNQATASNENLAIHSKESGTKDKKLSAKARLEQIKKDKEEAAEQELRQRQQMQQFVEMLKRQQMAVAADFLEKADLEKHVEEKSSDDLMVTTVEMQGWRKSMEDAHIAELPGGKAGPGVGVYGVFDGHSGQEVAAYAAEHLLDALTAEPEWKEGNLDAALAPAFLKLDAAMRAAGLQAGSTATVVVVDHNKNKVHCANAGDSRAVMSQGGKTVELSEDHKPNAPEEQKRIEAAGSNVQDAGGVPRVNGQLAVSRGFGDFQYKGADSLPAEEQAVTSNPEIRTFDLTNEIPYITVACDGIWDKLTSEQVVERLEKSVTGAENVGQITDVVKSTFDEIVAPRPSMLGSDNMSMIVVRFNKHCAAQA